MATKTTIPHEDKFLIKQHRANRLMQYIHQAMQPSALKHVCVASVVNALEHPVRKAVDKTNPAVGYVAAFGDSRRTIPLFLIVDQSPKGGYTVRHAFTPNPQAPKGDKEYWALEHLQANENEWAKQHQATPRNLRREIMYYGREAICQHGLPQVRDAKLPILADEFDQNSTWFATSYLSPEDTVDHAGRPDLTDSIDRRKLEKNIDNSLNDNLNLTLPFDETYVSNPRTQITLTNSRNKSLKVTKLKAHDTETRKLNNNELSELEL